MCEQDTSKQVNRKVRQHEVVETIKLAMKQLRDEGDPNEDGRAKALVMTKLQEALMWSERIYKPFD